MHYLSENTHHLSKCIVKQQKLIIVSCTNLDIPLSGICHTLTTQSSEPDAITLSLWGHHAMSKTGPLWPPTRG